MKTKLEAVVFVFVSKRKPFRTEVAYLEEAEEYSDLSKWDHVATLEPAVWIKNLANHPEVQRKHLNLIRHKRYHEPCT